MKNAFKYYAIIWSVLLVLFNIIVFLPTDLAGVEKYSTSFWVGYVFITLSFAGQIICTYFGIGNYDIKKTFYTVSLVSTSYWGLILSFIFGGLCMLIPFPYWLSIVICAAVLAFNIITVVKAAAAIELVSGIDAKIKGKTFFIKSLTVDSESLVARAKSDAVRSECKKVYEALRYSDPMSNEALAYIDNEISNRFTQLAQAVAADNPRATADLANGIVILIGDRNKKCKLLK